MYPLMNLDNDLLRTFVVVARTQSLTRAAEQLLRTQSTLSLQLKRLETQLNCILFHRTPRSVTLTPSGRELLPRICSFLDIHDALVDSMTNSTPHGNIRFGAPEDFATTYLAQILAQFTQNYPQVSLQVECDLTLNLMRKFQDGLLDVIIIKREPQHTSDDGIAVWEEKLVWVSSTPDFLRSSDHTIPLALSPEPCVYRKRALQALDYMEYKWNVVYTCGSLAGTIAAVEAGLGITVLPNKIVPQHLYKLENKLLPQLKNTEMALINRKIPSIQAQKLSDYIIKHLTQYQ
jgi:DNA-binding transcriptional LysR family regulator